jgi:UDP-N-acetylmuramoylalanine-D-glutamate ligase
MSYAIKHYQSDYSIFTNLKPDHLNWHKDLQEYLDAKMNLIHRTSKVPIVNKQIIDFV